ncbi:MAG TPA: toprim domain-containing protein [Candidatus Avimonas sp.]|nr:DNA topoisomerase [Clostridiales bacterium]HOB36864.1 toprim domain-containing protein [Candidatus Avimonas sp.]HQA16167.1 toprim domain-containing protein [Candidatus Avimonas sp.]HQD38290.1 toprim domain-containing protein [Candidatus Avimonas sp.]
MAARSQRYGNESITSLKGADRVRKRPSVIFGSDGLEGCQHAVFEILSNAIDEAREGFGSRIIVTRFKDGSIEVQDFGRGIPVDYNPNEERYNWELIFCELYAGGKYNTNQGGSYEFSLGLNGLGACATQYASEYMDVEVKRDGYVYTLHFERGENIGGLKKEPYSKSDTGTRIRWKPDIEVFTEIDVPIEYFKDTLKRQAIVNPNLLFILRNQTENGFEEERLVYEKGIEDYVREVAGDDALTEVQVWSGERKGRDRADKPEYKAVFNVAFCFSNRKDMLEYYHNSSWLEHGGSPERAVRSAFVSKIDGYLKQNCKYLKNESKITFQDIQDCLVLVSSSFSTITSYANQTKKAISNRFIQEAMTEFLKENLEVYFIENPVEANKIAEQVLINKRSREKAEKTRLNLKKTLQSGTDLASRVQSFVDCRSKSVDERELFIVEGKSAMGACIQARDPEFQGIIPLRGKILNCLKADYNKIFQNEIITDLIKVLGCGVEVKTKASKDLATFDIDQLRWNKIIVCTDADVDGFHIRTLILAMLYRLTPTLIEKGKVYIAETPLYEITCKDKTYFAYCDREKAEILAKLDGARYTIQRSKGLGENDPEMMSLTTMNPATRRLIQVSPTDAEETLRMFEMLLGDDLQGRKEIISQRGSEYLEMADVS